MQLAMSLGASVVIRESEDVVGALLGVVREGKVSLLVVGRPSRRGLLGRVSPGIVQRLQEVKGFDLLIDRGFRARGRVTMPNGLPARRR